VHAPNALGSRDTFLKRLEPACLSGHQQASHAASHSAPGHRQPGRLQATICCAPTPVLHALQPPVLRRCRQLHSAVQRHRAEQEQRARRATAGTISKVAHAAASFVGSVASSVLPDRVVSSVSSPPQPSALEMLQEAGVPVECEEEGQRADSGNTGMLCCVAMVCGMHFWYISSGVCLGGCAQLAMRDMRPAQALCLCLLESRPLACTSSPSHAQATARQQHRQCLTRCHQTFQVAATPVVTRLLPRPQTTTTLPPTPQHRLHCTQAQCSPALSNSSSSGSTRPVQLPQHQLAVRPSVGHLTVQNLAAGQLAAAAAVAAGVVVPAAVW
jgi:hypothetical protein